MLSVKYKNCCAYCSNFKKGTICNIDNAEVDIFCGCEDDFNGVKSPLNSLKEGEEI